MLNWLTSTVPTWIKLHSIDRVLAYGVDWVAVGSAFIGVSLVIAWFTIWKQERAATRSNRIENTWRLMEYWRSQRMLEARKLAVRELTDPRIRKASNLGNVLNFFDNVGYFLRKQWIDVESVDLLLGQWVLPYWVATKDLIAHTRKQIDSHRALEEFEYLHNRLYRCEKAKRKRGSRDIYAGPISADVSALLEDESALIPDQPA